MRRSLGLLIALSVLLAQSAAQSADPATAEEPTHILQLKPDQSDTAIPTDAWFYSLEGRTYLSVRLPDGERVTAEYILTENEAIKFQLTRIAEERLVAIQFVGGGRQEERHQGRFTAFVDGDLREDMSGIFVLSPKQ
jgi:hypothetical protein